MHRDDFKEIGVTKSGPLDILLKENASLLTKSIFVDHNSYLFGKILNSIVYNQWDKVKINCLLYTYRIRIVRTSTNLWITTVLENLHNSFYRKGVSIQQFYPNTRVLKRRVFCRRIEYLNIWSYYIGSHEMDGRNQIFMPSVTTRVQKLYLFVVLVSSYLVDFMINHGNPLEDGASLIKLYFYT